MDKIIEQNAKVYENENMYYHDNELVLTTYSKRIVDILGKEHAGELSALDLGIGHGFTENEFERYFRKYTILEGDEEVIRRYKETHTTSNIIHTYFEEFETDEKFDVIILGFVLEHVVDPSEMICQYKQFLKEDGKIFIAVPNAEALNRRIGYVAGMIDDMHSLSENDIASGHRRYYDIDTIKKECQDAGLAIHTIEGLYLKLLTTNQMKSLCLDASIYQALCTIGRDYPELCLGILIECGLKKEKK